MNEAQKRVIQFAGMGAGIGLAIALCLPRASGNPESLLLPAIFGMMCGAIAAWLVGLR